uniref:Uncharacterized protein n=1 Tax=Macaca fascicularis TaxID=9541 RepID=A0A7N9D302_MACFA
MVSCDEGLCESRSILVLSASLSAVLGGLARFRIRGTGGQKRGMQWPSRARRMAANWCLRDRSRRNCGARAALCPLLRRRERHRLESVAIRRTHCAAAVALRPTTFRSRPVANVATLPSARESITGVLRLKDEIPPELVE